VCNFEMLKTLTRARGVLVVVALALLAGCDVYAPSWSTIHADGRNSDYSPVEGARALEPAWSREFEGLINVGATIDPSGRAYLTTSGGPCHLHVLDVATGDTIWCSSEVNYTAVISSPLIDRDGRIYLADDTAMHAFERDGTLLWETSIVGAPLSAQLTPNGRLVFITNIGTIYVLHREDGSHVLPPYELIPGATYEPLTGALLSCAQGTADCPSANTPSIDLATGRVTFTFWAPGAPQASVRAVQISEDPVPSITPLWSNDTLPGGSASSPSLSADGTRVYVTDNVGSLHALDAATGETIWSTSIGYASGGSVSVTPDGRVMPAGGGTSPLLAVADRGDHGELLWSRPELVNRGIPTQVAGDISYATVQAPNWAADLVVVDATDGTELDRHRLPGTPIFTVGTTVANDGTVLVPTISGDLHAYRPQG
jgi:outer membrane protein assembly factor BamB